MTDVSDLYTVEKDGGVVISVHVQPGAGRSAVVGRHGQAVKVRVAAPPVDNRANEATLALLATTLDVPPGSVALVSGDTSRMKRFRVTGVEVEDLADRLERVLAAAAEPPGPKSRRGH